MMHDVLLLAAGFLGGGGTALINNWFRRRHDAADTAKTLSDVAIAVGTLNLQLQKEIESLKKVLMVVTDAIDAILPHIDGMAPEQVQALKDANTAAKMAI